MTARHTCTLPHPLRILHGSEKHTLIQHSSSASRCFNRATLILRAGTNAVLRTLVPRSDHGGACSTPDCPLNLLCQPPLTLGCDCPLSLTPQLNGVMAPQATSLLPWTWQSGPTGAMTLVLFHYANGAVHHEFTPHARGPWVRVYHRHCKLDTGHA